MTPQPNEPTAEAIDAALYRTEHGYYVEPTIYQCLITGDNNALASAVRALRAENERLKLYEKEYTSVVNACAWMHDDRTLDLQLGASLLTSGILALKQQRAQLRASLSTAVDALEIISRGDLIRRRYVILAEQTLTQLRPLLAGKAPADPIRSETPAQREQRRVAGIAWLDNLGTKQPPAAEVKAEEAWLAKTPYERLADLVGAAEAKRILGTSAQAGKGGEK